MSALKAQVGSARTPTRRFPVHSRCLIIRATAAPAADVTASAASAAFTKKIVEDEAKYVLQTYGRPADVVFVRGEGAKLYDAAGKEYIDFTAGIAVNVLGHSDERWFAALSEQAAKLTHTSNLYHTVPQVSPLHRLM